MVLDNEKTKKIEEFKKEFYGIENIRETVKEFKYWLVRVCVEGNNITICPISRHESKKDALEILKHERESRLEVITRNPLSDMKELLELNRLMVIKFIKEK